MQVQPSEPPEEKREFGEAAVLSFPEESEEVLSDVGAVGLDHSPIM